MQKEKLSTGLGIDFGTKRIGLSLLLLEKEMISPLKTVLNSRHTLFNELLALVREYHVNFFVIGVPPKESIAKKEAYFATQLSQQTELPVFQVAEGLTTSMSKNMLSSLRKDSGLRVKTEKARDILSASLILEEWLTYYKKNTHGLLQFKPDRKEETVT